MAGELKIEDVQAKLEALLVQRLGDASIAVRGVTTSDFNAQGELLAPRPQAVLVLYAGTSDSNAKVKKISYQTSHRFLLICGAQNLSSVEAERNQALRVVSKVRAAVAGQVLQLEDEGRCGPIGLLSVDLEQFDREATWYSVGIEAEGGAQFGVSS